MGNNERLTGAEQDESSDAELKTLAAYHAAALVEIHRLRKEIGRLTSAAKPDELMAYVGTCPRCNNIVGAYVDDLTFSREKRIDMAQSIGWMIINGYVVNRHRVEGLPALGEWGCQCAAMKDAAISDE